MSDFDQLRQKLEKELLDRHGPMISGHALATWLGYATLHAFRQARARKKVPVVTFRIENRKGYFAMSSDIATWLASQRYPKDSKLKNAPKEEEAMK